MTPPRTLRTARVLLLLLPLALLLAAAAMDRGRAAGAGAPGAPSATPSAGETEARPPDEPAERPPAKKGARKKTAAKGRTADAEPGGVIDPTGPNAACYVCHVTFVHEELSKVHLAAQVDCIKCHGLSAAHANDEHVGATKPDIVFKRGQIDGMCIDCHEEHDVPARKVVARFVERKLTGAGAACTECHGTHKIEEADDAASGLSSAAGDPQRPRGAAPAAEEAPAGRSAAPKPQPGRRHG
jgi:hypothetical protein